MEAMQISFLTCIGMVYMGIHFTSLVPAFKTVLKLVGCTIGLIVPYPINASEHIRFYILTSLRFYILTTFCFALYVTIKVYNVANII